MNTARQGGMKVVLRFSYTNNIDGADAALDTIFKHIEQLGPIWQENYDVITYIEAGFIGAWGEWYYSSHGLNNTTARRKVLFKILSVLPQQRMAVIRTPGYKRNIFNNTQPLTADSAFTESYRARTGAHNDCFLADAWDMGTYENIEADKNYLNQDNRYVPQGGETCQVSSYSDCAHALADLARMHWSVLNKDYNTAVLNSWINSGCMPEIKRRLGYRFSLLQAILPDSVKPSGAFSLKFDLTNEGFASVYNPRNLEILLRNVQSAETYYVITSEDPRFWLSGDTVQVQVYAGIPANMPEGKYEVLLRLADPCTTLYSRPEYSIRLANKNVWEDSTGYNSLLSQVVISNLVSGDTYTGDNYFQPLNNHPSAVIGKQEIFPGNFELVGNYPNPFNSATTIEFLLKQTANVRLNIITLDGRVIHRLVDRKVQSGKHKVIWRPEIRIASGIYFYRLTVDGHSRIGKCIYVK
jgi:hypothetical protein